MPRYDSFIVRIWSDGGRCIHGYVVHVATKRRTPFRALARLPAIIQAQLRAPHPTAGPAEQAEGTPDTPELEEPQDAVDAEQPEGAG